MVEERLTDGRRIAEFLASEVTGHGDDLAPLAVTDADPDVEPSAGGALAYAIERDGERVASVFVEPERVRVAFEGGGDAAAEAAREAGLRVESAPANESASGDESAPAGESARLRTRVFVEDGAQVKWLLPALRVVASA